MLIKVDSIILQTIFSSGKSFESAALAILHSKGLFEYDDKVTKYWPEFGQNGKEDIKISDVCQHRAGLANFPEAPSIKDTWTENIKTNNLGALIEKLEPTYPQLEKHGSKCEYHAFTRGWILNEIIRRIDPKHRTMDEIFREEVNIDGIHITVDDKDAQKLANTSSIGIAFTLIESMIPKWAGRRIGPNIFTLAQGICKFFQNFLKTFDLLSYTSFQLVFSFQCGSQANSSHHHFVKNSKAKTTCITCQTFPFLQMP